MTITIYHGRTEFVGRHGRILHEETFFSLRPIDPRVFADDGGRIVRRQSIDVHEIEAPDGTFFEIEGGEQLVTVSWNSTKLGIAIKSRVDPRTLFLLADAEAFGLRFVEPSRVDT